ncbi:MAG: MarR family winged helix-turn-helix transcriptional regulator [Bacteriovorax sp.]
MSVKKIKTKKIEGPKIDEVCCDTKVHPGLKIYFGYSLYKSGVLYKNLMESHHLQKYELAASECGILYVLSTGSVVNQLSLGLELGIDKASIVKIIDKLEGLKLVKRDVDPNDRRSKLVSLTSKGKTTLEQVRTMRSEVEEQVFAHFSKEDQAGLRRLVPELLEVLMNVKL